MQACDMTCSAGFPYTHGQYTAGPLQNTLHGDAADPNWPELFRSIIQLVQEQVLRAHELAKCCLDDITRTPGRRAMQTEADLVALKAYPEMLAMHMRQAAFRSTRTPTEDALPAITERSSDHIRAQLAGMRV